MLRQHLKDAIPSLSEDDLLRYEKVLAGLGVESIEDLQLVDAADMVGVKKVHATKLKNFCREDLQSFDYVDTSNQSLSPDPARYVEQKLTEIENFPSNGQSSDPKNVNQYEPWVSQFVVPRDKMTDSLIEELRIGKPLGTSTGKEFVHIVCNEICTHNAKPSADELRTLCSGIIGKYPKAFEDDDSDETKIKRMIEKLSKKIKGRLEYITNKTKSPPKHSVPDQHEYNETTDDATKCTENQERIRDEMKLNHSRGIYDEESVKKQMSQTFSLRCQQLKQNSLSNAVEDWPFLFHEVSQLKNHFEQLTEKEVAMDNALSKKIVDFARHAEKYKASKHWTNQIEKEVISTNSLQPYRSGVYLVLLSMLEDLDDAFIKFVPDGITVDTISMDSNFPSTPVIIVKGSSIFALNVFEIFLNKKPLKYQPKTFEEAVNVVFMLYRILETEYSEGVQHFMTFIERFVVGLQSSKRRKLETSSKVDTLISELEGIVMVQDGNLQ